jgi:hypothetical protein
MSRSGAGVLAWAAAVALGLATPALADAPVPEIDLGPVCGEVDGVVSATEQVGAFITKSHSGSVCRRACRQARRTCRALMREVLRCENNAASQLGRVARTLCTGEEKEQRGECRRSVRETTREAQNGGPEFSDAASACREAIAATCACED